MKNWSIFLVLCVFLFSCSDSEKAVQPNVIIVITDDQGKNDIACEGNPYIKTPAIDKFHSEAVRLINFHVSTTCAPTRASLMTGRHTNRLNAYHTISGRSLLYEDEEILPEIFVANGYKTAIFGKWHLGDNYPFRPFDRGFQKAIIHGGGGITQMPDYWGNDYFDDTYSHNGVPEKFAGYCTDVFFDEAIKFIRENKSNPFFCYISTNAPHNPLNCPEEYLDIYDEMDLPENIKRFYGMITNIDDNFKKLEKELHSLGIADNTILIFMTDNGTAGGNRVYDAGMTGGKTSEYEGGHCVPFYIRWRDGNISGGRDVHQLTAHFDILPTMVDLLGLDHTPRKKLDGVSLVPLLKGQKNEWKERILYVDTQRELDLVKYRKYAVMNENWRLLNRNTLFDIHADKLQKNNVIDQHPEVAEKLGNAYEEWWKDIIAEGVDERFAYIKVGSVYENPVKITSHDLRSTSFGQWNQYGAVTATQASGMWKVEFVADGNYQVTLRRFPRESGLKINATFPAQPEERRLQTTVPASTKDDFVKATFYMGDIKKTFDIDADTEELTFETYIPEGKFDMEATLVDKNNVSHSFYFVYFEKK